MKRRDFLALVSSAGVGAAVGTHLGSSASVLSRGRLAGGVIRFSHRRQGVGHPVTIALRLPAARDLVDPPRPLVIREDAEGWFEVVGETGESAVRKGDTWTWSWVPPAVRPTQEERSAELVRFRVALLEEEGRGLGLASEPLEVVCGGRGWGT